MSRKIIGATVGTPMNPQAMIDKTEQAEQIKQNTEHTEDKTIHVTSEEKQTWNNKSNFSGSYNDLEDKPTIPESADLTGYATEDYVKEYAQPKGNYLTAIPSEYVTETELTAKKYLTSVPSEYVTETELTAKGYATQTSVTQLSEEIANIKALLVDGNGVAY